MTIDWDKPIETTEGFPARVISKDYRDSAMTLVVVQAEFGNGSSILRFSQDGTRMYHSTPIRNRKTKREGWVNVYRSFSGEASVGALLDTEEEAKCIGNGAVATIKIKWEE